MGLRAGIDEEECMTTRFEEILKRRDAEEQNKPKFKLDNKSGMILCNQLMARKLTEKDRVFVSSIMRQILDNKQEFGLTKKQWEWLSDIWDRYQR